MKATTLAGTDPARTPQRRSTRPIGREIRALIWLARHPGITLLPAAAVWAGNTWGPLWPAAVLAGLTAAVTLWWRVHPPTFDRWAGPWLRSVWRRWTDYRGPHWRAALEDVGLTKDRRRTGEVLCPRVIRVRAVTPSIDVLTVRLVRGQDLKTWTDRTEPLAEALMAHRVAVSKRRPSVLTVVVERELPFEHVIPAPEIPTSSELVDLARLDVGDNEYGGPFHLGVLGKHVLVAGASGAGKGSLIWSPLRAMGPLIRDGLVRVHGIDLKGGAELERGRALFTGYATDSTDALDLVASFRDRMKTRLEWMRATGHRTSPLTLATPLEVLLIDELAMLTAYGDRSDVREALRLLAEIMTQGRAARFTVMGYIQEPSKDILDVRDLFTTRVCLGVTTASHVDMVLGDGARERGAPTRPGRAGRLVVARHRARRIHPALPRRHHQRAVHHPGARPGVDLRSAGVLVVVAMTDTTTTANAGRRGGYTVTNDLTLIREIIRLAVSPGFVLVGPAQRVLTYQPDRGPRTVAAVPKYEADAVAQLLDAGHLKVGGTHTVHYGDHTGAAHSVLVPKATRDMVARWDNLRPLHPCHERGGQP